MIAFIITYIILNLYIYIDILSLSHDTVSMLYIDIVSMLCRCSSIQYRYFIETVSKLYRFGIDTLHTVAVHVSVLYQYCVRLYRYCIDTDQHCIDNVSIHSLVYRYIIDLMLRYASRSDLDMIPISCRSTYLVYCSLLWTLAYFSLL